MVRSQDQGKNDVYASLTYLVIVTFFASFNKCFRRRIYAPFLACPSCSSPFDCSLRVSTSLNMPAGNRKGGMGCSSGGPQPELLTPVH